MACGGSPQGGEKPLVIVSVVPQAFFVEKIAGDLVQVEVMIPPGASPATHEPTIAQLRRISRASLYVKVGHPHFPFEEAWLNRLLAESPGMTVLDASAGLEYAAEDPHLWLTPRHARAMARNIAAALAKHLPERADTLDANLENLLAEIDAVDAEIAESLRGRQGGKFVVLHPAWGHFAKEYGLEQLAIQRHNKEPDPKQLAHLIEQAKSAGIEVVFVQPHFNPASAVVVAREIGARVETLDPLAYEWSNNLRQVARRLAETVRR